MECLQYNDDARDVWLALKVLNLVISGMPSIPRKNRVRFRILSFVLNLVISGMPSIPNKSG